MYEEIGLIVLGLDERIEKRLINNGYNTVGSLLKCSYSDISGIAKLGESSVRQIRRRLICFLGDLHGKLSSDEAKVDNAVREALGIEGKEDV